jgi:hypothetical protein
MIIAITMYRIEPPYRLAARYAERENMTIPTPCVLIGSLLGSHFHKDKGPTIYLSKPGDPMKNLDELLAEGEVLRSMALYQLLRPGTRVDSEGDIALSTGQIEIRVFKYLNGERKGEFMAQPYLDMTYSAADFIGRGATEQEALYAMLDNIKGVPYERMFPDDEDD